MQQQRLGPYEIAETIGKGGMGSVHAAIDTLTGRRVAVKVLSPQLAHTEGFRERFEAEIESLKTLSHEGIVRLFGYGEQHGTLYYSMELVEGTSLEEELRNRRRFSWREVADIAIQLCRALKHAHDHGVVHRDIKPANILIDDNNHVKLADFGIARLFGSNQLTTAGGVLGTADYMSPEQADGRPVTDRCDQYSLGGVMYALLAGRPPFRAKNLPEMLQLQRYAEPEPVRRYASDTPEQLERVIAQLLSKDPAARFPNTVVLARHLEAMVRALSRPADDDFAVDEPSPRVQVQVGEMDHSLATTRAEDEAISRRPRPAPDDEPAEQTPAPSAADLHEAATLAAPEESSKSVSIELAPAARGSGDAATKQPVVSGTPSLPPSTFTDVEEEARRAELASQSSQLAVLGQVLGVLAALVAIVASVYFLTRPPSADALYARIQAVADAEEDLDKLRDVDNEVSAFLERFPDDPRAEEIARYQEHLELRKLDRRLQLLVRRGDDGDAEILPVERLYVQALATAETDPERAAEMLESMLALYSATTETDSTADETLKRRDCLKLAKRQLGALRQRIAQLAEQQLPELRALLSHADELAEDKPDRAQAIYQALVDLYGHRQWAESVVDEARARLVD